MNETKSVIIPDEPGPEEPVLLPNGLPLQAVQQLLDCPDDSMIKAITGIPLTPGDALYVDQNTLLKRGRPAPKEGNSPEPKERTGVFPPAPKDAWKNPGQICDLIKEQSRTCTFQQSPQVEQLSRTVKNLTKPLEQPEEQPARNSTILGENNCSPTDRENDNDEWTEVQQRCATSCDDVPRHSPEDSITVCCTGKAIRWTENEQHSGNSKSITLAPLAQVSDINDSSSSNYDKFAAPGRIWEDSGYSHSPLQE